jgi:hypothetical protein
MRRFLNGQQECLMELVCNVLPDSSSKSDFNLIPTLPKVKDGGSLNFVCTVKTFPRPAIWFILKEAVVKSDGVGYKLFHVPLGSVLRISPVKYKEYNNQDVMCTARLPGKKTRYRRTRVSVYENGMQDVRINMYLRG